VSLKTWKQEFYPVDASDTDEDSAAAHSLRKWEGLRHHNLDKHGALVRDNGRYISDGDEHLPISSTSCALCEWHWQGVEDDDGRRCCSCPLAIARQGTPCDVSMPDEEQSPWTQWLSTHDPEPMIHWLSLAAKEVVR
jgi:hypothetical protein